MIYITIYPHNNDNNQKKKTKYLYINSLNQSNSTDYYMQNVNKNQMKSIKI